jgi:lipopolysaccharide export system protein LptA
MSARIALIVLLLLAGCAARPLVANRPVAPTNPIDDGAGATTIDSDTMERPGGTVVTFRGNVVIRQPGSTQHTDRIDVYLDAKGDWIVGAVSTGHVRIVTSSGEVATGEQADYEGARERWVVRGPARAVWKDGYAADCDSIVVYLSRSRTPSLRCQYAPPEVEQRTTWSGR